MSGTCGRHCLTKINFVTSRNVDEKNESLQILIRFKSIAKIVLIAFKADNTSHERLRIHHAILSQSCQYYQLSPYWEEMTGCRQPHISIVCVFICGLVATHWVDHIDLMNRRVTAGLEGGPNGTLIHTPFQAIPLGWPTFQLPTYPNSKKAIFNGSIMGSEDNFVILRRNFENVRVNPELQANLKEFVFLLILCWWQCTLLHMGGLKKFM